MIRFRSHLAALALAAALGGAACTPDLVPPDMAEPRSLKPGAVPDAPACHTLPYVRGREGRVYLIEDTDGLLAVDIDGTIACVDDASGVLDSGVIPVTDVPKGGTSGACQVCENGDPLPASTIQVMASSTRTSGSGTTVAP